MNPAIKAILEASDEDKMKLLAELADASNRWREEHPKEYKRRHTPAPCSKCGSTRIQLVGDCTIHYDPDGYEGEYEQYKCPVCHNHTKWCRDALGEWNKNNPWPSEEDEKLMEYYQKILSKEY